MQHQEFEPPEGLRDSIKCFWYDRIEPDVAEAGFQVPPDGYAELIFHFGSALSMDSNGVLRPMASPFIMGLLDQPVVFHTDASLEIIAARCFPWTVFDLLGMQPEPGAVQLSGHAVASLQSALHECVVAGRLADAVTLLQQYFLDTRPQITTDAMLHKAGAAMRGANGTMPVSKVAATAHATVRTLERKFKQSSGHSVKDVSALMRFEQVRNHLWLYPDAGLAGLAQELGYADQSHLSREFKRYSGTTPGAFARKAKKRNKK